MAGKVWFPKEYVNEEKVLKKIIIERTKNFDCVRDIKVQTTLHLPNKYFTDVTIYVKEELYVAYLLGSGTKLDILVKENLESQYPINIRIFSN